MQKNANVLVEVTKDTIFSLMQKGGVISPDEYYNCFIENAVKAKVKKEIYQEITASKEIYAKGIDVLEEVKELTEESVGAIKTGDLKGVEKIIKEMKALENKVLELENKVYTDGLTKVKNRKYLNDKILEKGKIKYSGAIAFVDLKKFKTINDTYGHLVGDRILEYIAGKISKAGEVVRYGGDEFLVFSRTHNLQQEIGEIKKEVDKKRFVVAKKEKKVKFSATFDYGVVSFKKTEDFDQILERADRIMYEKKKR